MNTPSSPYALAQPREVDVAAIERALEDLWRAAHAEGEAAVLRAASMNLWYVTSDAADHAGVSDLVASLAVEHPSRAFLVRLGDEHAPPSQNAWVTAYCRRPTPASPQVCSELIELHVTGSDAPAVMSTLLSLRLPGLPTALVWDHSLSLDHPLLPEMAAHAERVIVSVIPPCGAAPSLRRFLDLKNRLGTNASLTDVAESLYGAWQAAVARLFDAQPEAARAIRSIEVRCADGGITAEMLYVLAWIAAALNWTARSFAWRAEGLEIHFAAGQRALLRSLPGLERSEIEIEFASGENMQRVNIAEPPAEIRLQELLLKQFRIWSRDPIREATLERVTEYLEAMEMPTDPPGFGHA